MEVDSFVSLLQFADGLFPSGGYAQSFGLEYYVQSGAIKDLPAVQEYLCAYLEGCVGPCDSVVAVSAIGLAQACDLATCLDVDRTLDAMKPVAEFRQASQQMGRQMLRVASSLMSCPLIREFSDAVEAGHTPGHHALVFGLVAGVLSWPPQSVAAAYLYSAAALLVSAALRLLPLGQIDGQRVLWATRPLIVRLAQEAAGKGLSDLWSFAPGIEIAGMRHAAMTSRLFRS